MIMRSLILSFLVLFLCQCESGTKKNVQRPNVILIMVDDLGYHDLSCYGHAQIKTPVLDKMAQEGMRLTHFYTGATVCTPSRIALLTGAYPTRLGWERGVMGYLTPPRKGLSLKALTMAEVFKQAGYKTAISGKWHLGDGGKLLPPHQGFEDSYFIKRSNNQTNELWQDDQLAEKPFDNRLLTEKFTNHALKFIEQNKNNPFFLYLPYTAPHFPVEAHPQWKGKSQFGAYGDVVEELDARIGDIFSKLKTEKLDNKTVVIFMSDNGPQPREQASAKPFRGMKWSVLEGGTRVPFIIRYPGVVPQGQESRALVAAIDLLPTLSHVCKIDLDTMVQKSAHPIDGVNVWSTFTGDNTSHYPRKELLYWHGKGGLHAIRQGDWKLFIEPKSADLNTETGPILFNLAKENEEKTNLASQHPGVVKRLQELAKKRLADVSQNVIPFEDE